MQILATNTRRTKVLELSSGTHRIPDELKKHYLTDEHGAQYSTNLDRNRYGSDNNYLFTVIKHDLETLGLCPCLADVEIIDAKAQGDSQLVTAGTETCTCTSRATAVQPVQQPVAQGECSQLFEALVAAAAGVYMLSKCEILNLLCLPTSHSASMNAQVIRFWRFRSLVVTLMQSDSFLK